MPIGVYAGLALTAATPREVTTGAAAQVEAALALHERFETPLVMTAMDLSVEAEIFGCMVRMSDDDIPTVIERRVTEPAEIQSLPDPQPGEKRSAIPLEVVRHLVNYADGIPVLGCMIGPFSLAGRIFGVSETFTLTITDPLSLLALLEKVTPFLVRYALAFRQAGASGVIMAEPAAGLISPRSLAQFSAPFVRRVVEAVQSDDFSLIYHNCGAKLVHLPQIVEAGAAGYHFSSPMDILEAVKQVDGRTIIAGNLDAVKVFYRGKLEEVRRATESLLSATVTYPNFIISSGCDLPLGTPLENLAVFYETVREWRDALEGSGEKTIDIPPTF
jgi:uroporphyrinogen decarboxylase